MQFDEGERGFSFQKDGPLDMRMDPSDSLTARQVVNELSEKELGDLIKNFGEERLWRKGARAIIEARQRKPIETTKELANAVERVIPRHGKIHPATKIFQAIRIYVNKELETIEGSLKKAIKHLNPGGRVGVLSFHSLEDRIVKNVFREVCEPIRNLQGKKISVSAIQNLTKKPLIPSRLERRLNRRARSAKLRFCEKQ